MKVPSAVHLDRRRFAVAAGIILIVVVTVLVWSGPLVPRRIRILAGPVGSTYQTNALAYSTAYFEMRQNIHDLHDRVEGLSP